MKMVLLDPGHGLPDPGAVGPTGLQEQAVVLDVCKRVKAALGPLGYDAALTRTAAALAGAPTGEKMAAVSKSLVYRVNLAQQLCPALFVSVHCNAAENRAATGFEVFYNKAGEGAAHHVYDEMVAQLKSHRPRRVVFDDFYVLRKNTCPAILVELEFISNRGQEDIFRTPAGLDFYAKTLATGITNYLKV